MMFLSRDMTTFEPTSTNVAAAPIPTAFVALVVEASVGHMPRTSLSVGFSLSIPLKNTLESVFSFLAIGLFLLQAAIKPGLNIFIKKRSDYIHNEYAIGHAFRIVAEVPYYDNYYAAAGSIDELAF